MATSALNDTMDAFLAKVLRVDMDDAPPRPEVNVEDEERPGPDTNIKKEMNQLIDTAARFKRASSPFVDAYDAILDIMHWKDQKFSGALFIYYVVCCYHEMLFAGAVLLAIVAIVSTNENEGIFKPPTKSDSEPSAAAAGGGGLGGGAMGGGDGDGQPHTQPVSAYPSTASAPPTNAAPAARQGRGGALLAGLTGLVTKGVSKVADSLQGLGEARAAGRKIRQILQPATLTLEKIARLLNWHVPYNTWLVVALLSVVFVLAKLLPWWQCDLLMKLAFGYRMFIPGLIRHLRGGPGRRGPIDVFWDTLPTADEGPLSPATSPTRPGRGVTSPSGTPAHAGAAAPAAATSPRSSGASGGGSGAGGGGVSGTPGGADGSVAAPRPSPSTTAHKTPPARPAPPSAAAMGGGATLGAAPPAVEPTPQPAPPVAAAPTAAANPLVVKVAAETPLGSWSVIHVNSKRKGTLLVVEGHVAILLPTAAAPESVAVEYGEVLSVSKKGSSMLNFALMLSIRDPATGATVSHKLQLKNRDAAYALLCNRLGFPPADDTDLAKDKQV
eukprot:m.449316 g.449316  ORF g.449316 m.449316 type:complete len:555 (+) comp19802_c0_seq1:164-1828(+)